MSVKKKILSTLLIGVLAATMTQEVFAQKILADIANDLIPQMSGVEILISMISFLSGLMLGYKGVIKLKEYHEAKGKIPLLSPLAMLAAAACFVSLPALINIGIVSLGLQGRGDTYQSYKSQSTSPTTKVDRY